MCECMCAWVLYQVCHVFVRSFYICTFPFSLASQAPVSFNVPNSTQHVCFQQWIMCLPKIVWRFLIKTTHIICSPSTARSLSAWAKCLFSRMLFCFKFVVAVSNGFHLMYWITRVPRFFLFVSKHYTVFTFSNISQNANGIAFRVRLMFLHEFWVWNKRYKTIFNVPHHFK